MTNSGWTQPVLREFLAFAGFKGISTIAIWTDGSMETKRLYPNGNPLLATCEWWVPGCAGGWLRGVVQRHVTRRS